MSILDTTEFKADEVPGLFPELADKQSALDWCKFNEAAGPAFTACIDGRPVGFGGLRTVGLAEAWLYVTPDISERGLSDRITALRGMLEHLEFLQEERAIWKIWAEAVKEDGFSTAKQQAREDLLRFAGFKKNDNAFTKIIQEV